MVFKQLYIVGNKKGGNTIDIHLKKLDFTYKIYSKIKEQALNNF